FIVFVCPGLAGSHAPFWQERVIGNLKQSGHAPTPAEVHAIIEDLKASREDERGQRIADVLRRYGPTSGSARLFGGDRTLSMEEIAMMHGNGVGIGSHTQTHQILTCTTASA